MTTNVPAGQAQRLLEAQPRPSFLEAVPELALSQANGNELTWGQHTYSGIVVQVLKAESPLQLLNPFAPSRYGSGWAEPGALPGWWRRPHAQAALRQFLSAGRVRTGRGRKAHDALAAAVQCAMAIPSSPLTKADAKAP